MIPAQSDQSVAVGTKSGPRGPSEDLWGPQKGLWGLKRALLVALECSKGPLRGPRVWYGCVPPRYTLWNWLGCQLSQKAPKRTLFLVKMTRNAVFWLFSPAGWLHMVRNSDIWAGYSVATLWTPHMPIFRRFFLAPKFGPWNLRDWAKWDLLGPPRVPERPQGGPAWLIIMYFTCEKCFRAIWTLPEHHGAHMSVLAIFGQKSQNRP